MLLLLFLTTYQDKVILFIYHTGTLKMNETVKNKTKVAEQKHMNSEEFYFLSFIYPQFRS